MPMSESLSNKARRKTEELILKGSLAAGAKTTERDLAERLGMSRAPVREAIRELVSVGLLEQISPRQIVVRQLELTEVREIFEIREMLEARAVSLATERITTDQYNSLEKLHLAMKTTASKGEFSDYFDLNIAFHKLIHEIASAPRLATLIDQVMRESLLFRSRGLVDEKNIRASIEEHEQLLKALRAGDGELASLLMSRHIQGGFYRLELI
jgi:DNA-binding GntR family transcriptional regulator